MASGRDIGNDRDKGTVLSSVQSAVALQFLLQICRSEKLLFIAEKQESGSLGEGAEPVRPHVPAGGMGSGTAACPGPGGTAVPAARGAVLRCTTAHIRNVRLFGTERALPRTCGLAESLVPPEFCCSPIRIL